MSYTVEVIDPRQVSALKNTCGYNMSYDNYTAIITNPIKTVTINTPITVSAICHHSIGYDYYLKDEHSFVGYLVDDFEDYPPVVDEPLRPEQTLYVRNDIQTVDGRLIHVEHLTGDAPRKMYVKRQEGAMLMDFDGQIDTYRDFIGVPGTHEDFGQMVRIMGTAHHPVVPSGQDFYITLADWGLFTRTGQLQHLRGFYVNDLQDTPPIAIKPLKPAPMMSRIADVVSTPIPVQPQTVGIVRSTPDKLGFSWHNDQHLPVMYQVMGRVIARDYLLPRSQRNNTAQELRKGKTIGSFGTFRDDNRTLIQLRVEGDDINHPKHLIGVPELDNNGTRLLEEVPDLTELKTAVPARTYGATDHLFHYLSKAELFVKHDVFRIKRKGI